MNMPITIVTPTPKITSYIQQNIQTTRPQARWLIVWTNPNKKPPSSLPKSIKLVTYPKKYLPITDFSLLRNWSLKQVTTKWVFFIDSDEVIDRENWQKTLKLVRSTDDFVGGYLVKREDVFLGKTLKHGEVGSVWIMRLAKAKFMRYERVVHEVAIISGNEKKSNVILTHYPHPNISSFIAKVNFYAQLDIKTKTTRGLRLLFELIIYPPSKFLVNFIFKLGFLDGMRGLTYASVMSLHSLLVRIYLLEKQGRHDSKSPT